MITSSVIHPFPARMAPEIAQRSIDTLTKGQRLLDPMCGSGTVIRAAVEAGVEAVGVDIDPLAVLMTKVWATKTNLNDIQLHGEKVAQVAMSYSTSPTLEWQDDETLDYISYWFAEPQRDALARLAKSISAANPRYQDALKLALSKTIITKDKGASLARDVSHSRPHRSWDESSYDVYRGFARATAQIGKRLEPNRIKAAAKVSRGDTRDLSKLAEKSFDCVLTSPPYLNAIDYMRGHRLSLVWLGYSFRETTQVRSSNVGAERSLIDNSDVSPYLTRIERRSLPNRYVGWVKRYKHDAASIVDELARLLKPGGLACLVVGNSYIRGWEVDNAQIFIDLLEDHGFRISSTLTRDIPSGSRYLPPPSGGDSTLSARMRSEVVLSGHLLSPR